MVFSATTKLFLAGLDQKESNSSIPQDSNSIWKKLGRYRSVNQGDTALAQQIPSI